MKRKERFLLVIIFFTLFFTSNIVTIDSLESYKALSTTITSLEWSCEPYSLDPENYTCFDFVSEYAIYNPNNEPILLNFSYATQFDIICLWPCQIPVFHIQFMKADIFVWLQVFF